MSTMVLKYPLTWNKETEVSLPNIHAFLVVNKQDGAPTVWAEVDTDERHVNVTVIMFATGEPLPTDKMLIYIGTMFDGPFVWHFYGRYE